MGSRRLAISVVRAFARLSFHSLKRKYHEQKTKGKRNRNGPDPGRRRRRSRAESGGSREVHVGECDHGLGDQLLRPAVGDEDFGFTDGELLSGVSGPRRGSAVPDRCRDAGGLL